MGMGYAAVQLTAISYENLCQICKDEVAAVEGLAEFESWGVLAELVRFNDDESAEVSWCAAAISRLLEAFAAATKLSLTISYYSADDGDRYDEVCHKDGCVFEIEDAWVLSPAAEALKHKLAFCNYVIFG